MLQDLLGNEDLLGLKTSPEHPGWLGHLGLLDRRVLKESKALQARRVRKALLVLLGRRVPQVRRAILVPQDLKFFSHTAVPLTPIWRRDVSPASS